MMEFLLVLAMFLIAASAMALGVFFGRKPIQGSCGGMDCIKGYDCEACPNRQNKEHAHEHD
ncbi:MAG: (Na+)-NQR maturation NqrM [Maritimibacter sp.]